MEKVFGVVILYHPPQKVIENITTYLPFVEGLIVIDNSEPAVQLELGSINKQLFVIADANNSGIAERLNAAAKIALDNHAEWLLTMDQDSCFSADTIAAYINCFQAFNNRDNVAMFGVNYIQQPSSANCEAIEIDLLITSGSLVNLNIFKKIGGFDEKLFIDEVDSEYCLRAIVNNYRIIQFKNIYLHHSLGTINEYRSLKSLKKTPRSLHSPVRIYYMIRNYLYVQQMYKDKLPGSFPDRKMTVINRIKNNFLYGKKRWKLLKYIFLAYKHYRTGRMGKLK